MVSAVHRIECRMRRGLPVALACALAVPALFAAPSGSYVCYKPDEGQSVYPWDHAAKWFDTVNGGATINRVPTTNDYVFLYSNKNDVGANGKPMVVTNGVHAETGGLEICDKGNNPNNVIGITVQDGGTMTNAGIVKVGNSGSGKTGGGLLMVESGGAWTANDVFNLGWSSGTSLLNVKEGGSFACSSVFRGRQRLGRFRQQGRAFRQPETHDWAMGRFFRTPHSRKGRRAEETEREGNPHREFQYQRRHPRVQRRPYNWRFRQQRKHRHCPGRVGRTPRHQRGRRRQQRDLPLCRHGARGARVCRSARRHAQDTRPRQRLEGVSRRERHQHDWAHYGMGRHPEPVEQAPHHDVWPGHRRRRGRGTRSRSLALQDGWHERDR